MHAPDVSHWLTQVPVGLIVFHTEGVNTEQVLVIMKSCLVSSNYRINSLGDMTRQSLYIFAIIKLH